MAGSCHTQSRCRRARALCWIGRFGGDENASVLPIFVVVLPVLAIVVGAAIDYTFAASTKVKMQSIADSAAIAAVRELALASTNSTTVTSVATTFIAGSLPSAMSTVSVDTDARTVQVIINQTYTPITGGILGRGPIPLSASSTAKLDGSMPLCLLALDPSSSETISLQDNAVMKAPGCLVQTNSTNKLALDSNDSAVLNAGMICSVGGAVKFVSSNYSPQPTTDCPALTDPLSSRARPPVGACSYTNLVVDGVYQTLQPGTYCGGVKITNGANVTLAPGIFVMSGGPLVVDGGSSLKGTYVGLYLSGAGANLTFDTATTINLSAPSSGPLTGILVYDDPSGASAPAVTPASGLVCNSMAKKAQYKAPPRQHQIFSNNAQTLTGTIYMPKGEILVDATKPIASYSAYTVLIVGQLHLCAGPTLVLNTNYSATDVPVPMGAGPYSAKIFLQN
jgi:hypothetical protein